MATERPASNTGISLFSSRREAVVLCALLLALLTLALYEPAIHNDFVNFDDPSYLTANPHVRQGLSWSNVAWALTATEQDNWHPLTWISHMVDVQLFGLKPLGHHLVSVLLHTLNVVLLFLLLEKATGYVIRGAIIAGLFAVFPLNVEAVAWAAERKSVLCTTFLLLALFAYGWYARKPGIGRYLVLVLMFALGLTAKPMVITLPFLLFLIDYWPLERFPGFERDAQGNESSSLRRFLPLVMEKIPLFLMSLGSALVTLYAARRGGALSSTLLRPIGLRLENALWSYVAYIGKGLWPLHLAILYPFPDKLLPVRKVGLAIFLLVAISVGVWIHRQRRYLPVGWLWFLGTLVPVSGIAQAGSQAMADRYAYIPYWGLFLVAVWLIAESVRQNEMTRAAVAAVTIASLCGYAWVTRVQIGYWRDSVTVFSHALQVTKRNGIAEDNLGIALLGMGRPDLAAPHLEAAVQYLPEFSTAHFNLGTLLQDQKRLPEAKREYELTLEYTGDPHEAARAYNNLATVYLNLGQATKALSDYDHALRLDPNNVSSLMGRGTIEYQQAHLEIAKRDLHRAAELAPAPLTFVLLGRVLEDQGDFRSAANAYAAALMIQPNLTSVRLRLEAVQQKLRE